MLIISISTTILGLISKKATLFKNSYFLIMKKLNYDFFSGLQDNIMIQKCSLWPNYSDKKTKI